MHLAVYLSEQLPSRRTEHVPSYPFSSFRFVRVLGTRESFIKRKVDIPGKRVGGKWGAFECSKVFVGCC